MCAHQSLGTVPPPIYHPAGVDDCLLATHPQKLNRMFSRLVNALSFLHHHVHVADQILDNVSPPYLLSSLSYFLPADGRAKHDGRAWWCCNVHGSKWERQW